MNTTKEQYINWQKKLQTHRNFKLWWQFWSNYSLILLIPVAVYFWQQPKLWSLFSLSVASFVVTRFLLIPAINIFYKKPRPYQKYNFEPIISKFLSWKTERPTSFPSRHIISFMAVAGALLIPLPLIAIYILLVGLLTGGGRVVLGFHDYWDVFSAVIIGLLIGILIYFIFGSALPAV